MATVQTIKRRLARWADALESGQFKQVNNTYACKLSKDYDVGRVPVELVSCPPPRGVKMCCLTVAASLAPKSVQNNSLADENWDDGTKLEIISCLAEYYEGRINVEEFIELNDDHRQSFKKIAKHIRNNVIPSVNDVRPDFRKYLDTDDDWDETA